MRNLMYIIAAALVVFWAFGFFVLAGPVPMHFLLVAAFIIVLIAVLPKSKHV